MQRNENGYLILDPTTETRFATAVDIALGYWTEVKENCEKLKEETRIPEAEIQAYQQLKEKLEDL